jgi:hypothetical protein
MQKPRVLYIGLDPTLLDPESMPGFDAASVQAGVDRAIADLAEGGFEPRWCPVDRGETAEAVVVAELERERYEAVVIGAGLRVAPPHFHLFEQLLNAVHAHAPAAKICFNTRPTDTLDAVRRWLRHA